MWNILDFGARVENSPVENQKAIQAAVDAANAAGGGTVVVPAGRYMTGNIQLKSFVTLHLEAGATLKGSGDYRDYNFSSQKMGWASSSAFELGRCYSGFIWAENAEHITIEGPGTLDGNGAHHTYFPNPEDPFLRRPMLFLPVSCTDVRITDVTLRDPAMFTLLAVKCKRVLVRGVNIYSWDTENGDGLDFDGSVDVTISDCIIEAGDDAIGLKTTFLEIPCRYYTITNCILRSVWAGVRIGPESTADMTDIVISNCVFERCNDAIKIQDCAAGVIENVRISNSIIRNCHRPLYMTTNSYRLGSDPSIRPAMGGLRDIMLSGITAYMSHGGEDYQKNCFIINGTMEETIRDVTLRDIKVFFDGGGTEAEAARTDIPEYLDYSFIYADIFCINGRFPAAGLFLRHIDGLKLIDCDFRLVAPDKRPMIYADDVKHVLLRDVEMTGECPNGITAVEADITLKNCTLNGECVSVEALTPEEMARYRQGRADAELTHARFSEYAKAVDAAEKLKVGAQIAPEAWTVDGAIWRTAVSGTEARMLQLSLCGDVDVLVNGKAAGSCRIAKPYHRLVKWACDVSALWQEGENTIELRWDDPTELAGMDSLLPFGEFRPLKAGLQSPALLRK